MMDNITVTGFYIDFFGDHSVGEFDATFIIKGENGDFEFSNHEDLEAFRKKIQEAFELCVGEDGSVETFEEREKRVRDENILYDAIHTDQVNNCLDKSQLNMKNLYLSKYDKL